METTIEEWLKTYSIVKEPPKDFGNFVDVTARIIVSVNYDNNSRQFDKKIVVGTIDEFKKLYSFINK